MSSQPEWLIRSGSRVLGPYTQGEILLKLREKELSLHDEVSEPLGRWWTIQYHPRMEEVVEDFRSQTGTDRTDALSGTNTSSLTDNLADVTPKQKVEPKVVETFGVYKQSPQSKNLKWIQNLLWVGSFVVIIAGVFYLWNQQKTKLQKTEQNEQVLDLKKAEQALFIGDYPQALEFYKKVAAKNPQNRDLAIYLAPLYLQVGNQTLMAKREFENIANLNQSAEAQTAYGLMFFMDGNMDEALNHWNQAIQLNPQFDPAALNVAYLYMQNKAWNHAREWIETHFERNQFSADWNIAYAVASLEAYEKNKNQRYLTEAQNMLSDLHPKIQDRMQDILLLRVRTAYFLNEDDKVRRVVMELLNQEIDSFKKVRHNAFTANRWFEDEFMMPMCRKTSAMVTTQPEKSLLEVYCFIRANQMDLAQKKINQLREQMPKQALVQAWASYLLDQMHQQEEASVLLGRANEMNRASQYPLPYILQGQFCFSRRDYGCAEQNWQTVLRFNPSSLPAQTALASTKFLSGRQPEAREDIKRIQAISEDYKPLLELMWKDKEGGL